jgi:hypothetical protein
VADSGEVAARWDAHPLAVAAPIIRASLGSIAKEAEHLIVVSDAEGLLLWVEGNRRVRARAAETINFTEGAMWSEGAAGTNAVGTALAADHAVQVFAAEHFNEVVQAWTCAAAPVRDPDTQEVLGVIDLTGAMSTVHPHSFGCAVTAAQAVELHLRLLMQQRDQRLRSKYGARMAAGCGRRALVTPTGRVIDGDDGGWTGAERLDLPPGGGEIVLPSGLHGFAEPVGHEEAFVLNASDGRTRPRPILRLALLGEDQATVEVGRRTVRLSRRHTEILALLADRPEGMTAEELAADLYGDDGQPGTVRVQVFRLRKLLGDWLDTEPYRVSVDVECDVAQLQGLLDRGAIREAAERYTGRLLPHSEAPGVVRQREALEGWLRQAVMMADDPEALWAWVQAPSGRNDLPAWRRLLANLDYATPRHSLVAARVAALRAAYS